jgi:hypothetical protein
MGTYKKQTENSLSLREQWGAKIEESTLDEEERVIMRGLDDDLVEQVLRCATAYRFLTLLKSIDPAIDVNPGGGHFAELPEQYLIILKMLNGKQEPAAEDFVSGTRGSVAALTARMGEWEHPETVLR